MARSQHPVDQYRTANPRAGEWFKNTRDLLGLFLLAVGVVGVAVCLAAAAHERTQLAIGTGIAAGLALVCGAAWLYFEGRRIRRIEETRPAEPHAQTLLGSGNSAADRETGPMRSSGFPIES